MMTICSLRSYIVDVNCICCRFLLLLPGVLLLLHLLAQWNCPPGLLAKLAPLVVSNTSSSDSTVNSSGTKGSSRVLLLCLAWLIGHCQLFDRALQHLQLPEGLLPLLPPYPEVRCARLPGLHVACAAFAVVKYQQQHFSTFMACTVPVAAAPAADCVGEGVLCNSIAKHGIIKRSTIRCHQTGLKLALWKVQAGAQSSSCDHFAACCGAHV